jgi:hypothetical protein
MAGENPNWATLGEKYPAKLITALRGHFARGPFRISAHSLAIEANVKDTPAAELLNNVASSGAVRLDKRHVCPCDRTEALTTAQASEEVCAHCQLAFNDLHEKPIEVTEFVREAPQTRDVRWMLALHGMNTNGAWQETFNWLVSRTYRRSVPIAIYKYGIVRPGAVLKFRLDALVRGLNARIRRLSGETGKDGFGSTPDVIAHSLGTWLLGHALMEDETLRVGRVVLTGCILRPDFDWALILRRKQVEAVFCHVATKDFWAHIAHYIIPDSGPSGRRGFNDRKNISHAILKDQQHSDFFKETEMPTLFKQVWQPFLTEPAGPAMTEADKLPALVWSETWWPFRATVFRVFLLAIALGLALAGLAALLLGVVDLWRWI